MGEWDFTPDAIHPALGVGSGWGLEAVVFGRREDSEDIGPLGSWRFDERNSGDVAGCDGELEVGFLFIFVDG
jgi:hypothetical protein